MVVLEHHCSSKSTMAWCPYGPLEPSPRALAGASGSPFPLVLMYWTFWEPHYVLTKIISSFEEVACKGSTYKGEFPIFALPFSSPCLAPAFLVFNYSKQVRSSSFTWAAFTWSGKEIWSWKRNLLSFMSACTHTVCLRVLALIKPCQAGFRTIIACSSQRKFTFDVWHCKKLAKF